MKNERLRKLLASFVEFQVIRDDYIAQRPKECAIFHTLSLDKNTISGKRIVEKTDEYIIEETARLVEAYLQIDFIAATQTKAEEMANELFDVITFKNRNDLIRNGYGLSDEIIKITDRTFIEGSQYIYRFGFDLQMNWREITRRKSYLIKDIKVEFKEARNGEK